MRDFGDHWDSPGWAAAWAVHEEVAYVLELMSARRDEALREVESEQCDFDQIVRLANEGRLQSHREQLSPTAALRVIRVDFHVVHRELLEDWDLLRALEEERRGLYLTYHAEIDQAKTRADDMEVIRQFVEETVPWFVRKLQDLHSRVLSLRRKYEPRRGGPNPERRAKPKR